VRTAVSGLRLAGCLVSWDKENEHLRLECSAKWKIRLVGKL